MSGSFVVGTTADYVLHSKSSAVPQTIVHFYCRIIFLVKITNNKKASLISSYKLTLATEKK